MLIPLLKDENDESVYFPNPNPIECESLKWKRVFRSLNSVFYELIPSVNSVRDEFTLSASPNDDAPDDPRWLQNSGFQKINK